MSAEQGSLFSVNAHGGFEPAPSRSSDPPSSKDAGTRHARSGKRDTNAALVLSLVRRFPRSTYAELYASATSTEQAELGDDKEVARRIPELIRAGKIRRVLAEDSRDAIRACRVKATKMTFVEATE